MHFIILAKKKEFLGKTSKAYSPTQQTCSNKNPCSLLLVFSM